MVFWRVRKITKNFSYDSWTTGQKSNSEHPEYKVGTLEQSPFSHDVL